MTDKNGMPRRTYSTGADFAKNGMPVRRPEPRQYERNGMPARPDKDREDRVPKRIRETS